MLPSPPQQYVINRPNRATALGGERKSRIAICGIFVANETNNRSRYIVRKMLPTRARIWHRNGTVSCAASLPALGALFYHVVQIRSRPKVRRIYAWRIVAGMKAMGKRIKAVGNEKRNSVGRKIRTVSTPVSEPSISTWQSACSPHPALSKSGIEWVNRSVFIDLLPKTTNVFIGKRWHQLRLNHKRKTVRQASARTVSSADAENRKSLHVSGQTNDNKLPIGREMAR